MKRTQNGEVRLWRKRSRLTYEQWKEERHAREERTKQQKGAAAERDSLIMQAESNANRVASEEMAKWQAAYDFAHSGLSQAGTQTLVQLRGWGAAVDGVAGSLANYWTQWLANERQSSRRKRNMLQWIIGITASSLGIGVIAYYYIGMMNSQEDGGPITLLWLIVVAGEIVSLGVCLPLIVALGRRKSKTLERTLKNQIDNQVKWWMSLSEPEHKRRLSNIDSELQRLTNEAHAQYQRRMDEIAAEHARTLAEIESRYADG